MRNTPVTPIVDNGNWSEQKTKLKAKLSSLTDPNWYYENDNKDELLCKLQAKLGKTREELDAIILAL